MKIIKMSLILIFMLLSSVVYTWAEIPCLDAGVVGDPTMDKNTYEYTEILFITGEPIELHGTIKKPVIPKGKDKYNMSYEYNLFNVDKGVTLNRKITYNVEVKRDSNVHQTITKAEISKLDESIKVGDIKYTLAGYIFDKSALTDNTPAVDYYSGSIYYKRTYYKNGNAQKNEGKVIVEANTDAVIGYNHKWGNAETNIINYKISFSSNEDSIVKEKKGDKSKANDKSKDKNADKDESWDGFVTVRMSYSEVDGFEYLGNEPQNISFRGSYIKRRTGENILQCQYDLPAKEVKEEKNDYYRKKYNRNKGELNVTKNVVLDRQSLIVPKIRDIGGHWSEHSVFLLSSLGIIKPDRYYSPETPISRVDFSVALCNAIADVEALDSSDRIKVYRNEKVHPYIDYNPKGIWSEEELEQIMKTYNHIDYLKKTGVLTSYGDNAMFYPNTPIRRAEAIQMIARALGIIDLAPAPPYKTGFVDDSKIPHWAKDGIYMANEIGLVTGYSDGTIRPESLVSRADASVMIDDFIRYIKDNITFDYREKLINKN